MEDGNLFANIDIAEIMLWAFTLFFVGLIFYLRREDRREGYPLEADVGGRIEPSGSFFTPDVKTFRTRHGGETSASGRRDVRPPNATRLAVWSGAPSDPVGDPMQSGFGPGAWADRADVPDVTWEGEPRIAPLRSAPAFFLAKESADPRGMEVVGADGVIGGVVEDIWIDKSEALIRYLEIRLPGPVAAAAADPGAPAAPMGGVVLLPMPFATVNKRRSRIEVSAVLGAQIAGAPVIASRDQVTLLEEDKISAYFGGGLLYATPKRREPLL